MEQETSLEVQGAGLRARLSGLNGDHALHFVIIVLLGILIYLVIKTDSDRELRALGFSQQLAKMVSDDASAREAQLKVLKAIQDLHEEQQVTTYVLTRTQTQRESLNLDMPRQLRERQRQ